MDKVKLSANVIEDLKAKAFKSVIIQGATNPAEVKDNPESRLMASKEPAPDERITAHGFHIAIDDPALLEVCQNATVFIEIP
ncbi:hypothetical protein [Chitinophaga japonensis]|uniref:Uncharacterized protein n=1 Tax=Chitinophaga japonensis TaxID=104662 RepID=A0A562SMP6_CHIJA|nr:hypothetical protein [Chitinophaga japonensis]TWI82522.1 hypothetical protein LX66_5096 [Chitinophaga japonensis]